MEQATRMLTGNLGFYHSNFIAEAVERSLRRAALRDEMQDRLEESSLGPPGGEHAETMLHRESPDSRTGCASHGRTGSGLGSHRNAANR